MDNKLKELRRKNREKKKLQICFQDIFLELMNDWKIQVTDVREATDIPWSTLHDWYTGKRTPFLDANLMALKNYFNCSLEYLLFGIGEEPVVPENLKRKKSRKK
ncbi:MAG TPA: helix-turn-helix transcriptional regulator [Emticicia sp.]